jgi:hypothetical protein
VGLPRRLQNVVSGQNQSRLTLPRGSGRVRSCNPTFTPLPETALASPSASAICWLRERVIPTQHKTKISHSLSHWGGAHLHGAGRGTAIHVDFPIVRPVLAFHIPSARTRDSVRCAGSLLSPQTTEPIQRKESVDHPFSTDLGPVRVRSSAPISPWCTAAT